MAGGWGAPIQAPMQLTKTPIIRSPGNPGLPALEDMPSVLMTGTGINTLRAKDAVSRRLPGIAGASEMSAGRKMAAEEFARDMGAAYAYSKFQDKKMRAKARAKARAADAASKRRKRR